MGFGCVGGRCEIASMDGADRDCATATAEKTGWDDGRLRWTARIDGFLGSRNVSARGERGVGEIWTASGGGRAGCPNRAAAAWCPLATNGCGGWNSLGKREIAMRGYEVRGSSKRAFNSKKRLQKSIAGSKSVLHPARPGWKMLRRQWVMRGTLSQTER